MSNQAKTKPQQEAKPRKTYLFRIYPTRKQIHTLEHWLGLCCQLYNAALDEHQCAELPGCKAVHPDLADVPSRVLQDVVKRLDLAFDHFFRRIQQGRTPAIPALNPASAMTP